MAYLGKTPSQAVRSRYYFTATGGETSLSGTDDNSNTLTFTDGNYVDVALNGVTLVAGTDYNTTTANTIGGLTALVASDVVEVIVYDTFSVFGGNMAADLNFKDNVKANFGTGNDLQIYHDGSNSFIDDAGTGDFFIRSNKLYIQKYTGESMAIFTADGAVDLRYDDSQKLVTTATGVDVTGTISSNKGSAGTLATFTDGVNSNFVVETSSLLTTIGNGGGSAALALKANNTEAMRIDSSGNVGIGTSSPDERLHVFAGSAGTVTASTNANLVVENSANSGLNILTPNNQNGQILFGDPEDNDVGRLQYNHTSNYMALFTNANERLRIASTGELLVGTTSDTMPAAAAAGQAIMAGTRAFIATEAGGDTILGGTTGSNFTAIYQGGSERWRINAAGHMVPANTNNGIILGSTASVASNLLNDYEEGDYDCTVTPSTSGSVTLNTFYNRASYTKVGRLVTVNGFLIVSSVSSPVGYFTINLPFVVASLTDRAGDTVVSLVIQNVSSTNISNFVGGANQGSSLFYVQLGDALQTQNDSAQELIANSYIAFSLTYPTT
jgi:hypothetical protein